MKSADVSFGSGANRKDDIKKSLLVLLQVTVNPTSTLLQALKDPRYRVMGGTPAFVILVDKSPFQAEFLAKYQ